MTVEDSNRWMSTREASDKLGVTLRTLYLLIDQGSLPAYKIGRVIRLKADDVEQWKSDDPDDGGPHDRQPRRPKPPARPGSARLATSSGEPALS
jgi:excisionase family DNA binding protein